MAGLAAVAIVTAAAGGVMLPGGRIGSARGDHGRSSNPSPARVVSASAATPVYSGACMIVGIAFHDPRFGRATFDRTIPCLRGLVAFTGQRTRRAVHPRGWFAIRRHT
jgi:hypothetical protein